MNVLVCMQKLIIHTGTDGRLGTQFCENPAYSQRMRDAELDVVVQAKPKKYINFCVPVGK